MPIFEKNTVVRNFVILGVLLILFIASCEDDPGELTVEVTGVILDETSKEPIENVELIGFDGGFHHGNLYDSYGPPVSLGFSDKCGKFKITLTEILKGYSSNGQVSNTHVRIRLHREDFGLKEIALDYESGYRELGMTYSPEPKAFFEKLFLVQAPNGQSISIGWKIYSLEHYYRCADEYGDGNISTCTIFSDGSLHIQRSDSNGFPLFTNTPIELNVQQTIQDGDLPTGDIGYLIHAGPASSLATYFPKIIRTNFDTLFLVKPPTFPVLNHCN